MTQIDFDTRRNDTSLVEALRRSAFATGPAPLVARVLLGALFIISGVGKLAAPGATIAYISATGLPLPELGYAIAVLVEVLGTIALVLGYRTSLVAFGMALFTLATALVFHNNLADQAQAINFWKNVAITGGLLQVALSGAGRWSLDALRNR